MNGGSIRLFITLSSENKIKSNKKNLNKLYKIEDNHFLNLTYNLKNLKNVEKSKLDLKNKLKLIKKQNKKIHVYGASTKGNVILQYCGISNKDIKSLLQIEIKINGVNLLLDQI